MHKSIIALLALLLVAQAPSYRIRVSSNPDVGKRQIFSTDSQSKQTITAIGKTKNVTETGHSEAIETMTRRSGANATMRLELVRSDRDDDTGHHPDPLQGKTFTITVHGDTIGILSSDGQPLSERNRASMAHEIRTSMRAEANNACIPTDPLTIGSTWNIATADAGECLSGFESTTFSQSTGTLSAVANGTATIDYRFSLRVKTLGPLEFDEPTPVDGTMQMRVSLTDPLAWTCTTKWHLKGTAHPSGPSMPPLFTEITASQTAHSRAGS